MPVHADAVGTSITGPDTTITTRQCLAYAAAIGDTAAQRFDDLDPTFIAPPQMCVAIEWPVVIDPNLSGAWRLADDEARRGVHVTQDSVFHRPLRPGDRLRTEGRLVGAEPDRTGTRIAMHMATVDDRGAPVVDSFLTSLFRGVELAGDAQPPAGPPAWPEPAGDTSAIRDKVQIEVSPQMAHVYTECSGIWNPIHTERSVARAAGLPDLILHGTATWALAGREIVARVAGGDARRLARLSGRFAAMVPLGSTLTVTLASADAADGATLVSFEVTRQDGRAAISNGRALVRSA